MERPYFRVKRAPNARVVWGAGQKKHGGRASSPHTAQVLVGVTPIKDARGKSTARAEQMSKGKLADGKRGSGWSVREERTEPVKKKWSGGYRVRGDERKQRRRETIGVYIYVQQHSM
jgi:hypothetical protein